MQHFYTWRHEMRTQPGCESSGLPLRTVRCLYECDVCLYVCILACIRERERERAFWLLSMLPVTDPEVSLWKHYECVHTWDMVQRRQKIYPVSCSKEEVEEDCNSQLSTQERSAAGCAEEQTSPADASSGPPDTGKSQRYTSLSVTCYGCWSWSCTMIFENKSVKRMRKLPSEELYNV
jgi:hypothetical protein